MKYSYLTTRRLTADIILLLLFIFIEFNLIYSGLEGTITNKILYRSCGAAIAVLVVMLLVLQDSRKYIKIATSKIKKLLYIHITLSILYTITTIAFALFLLWL